MPTFTRSFDTESFTAWFKKNPYSAFHELFRRWAPPGTASAGETCLRLAVRAGYLNFYVKGQSVAKLSCGPKGPRVSVHGAYVEGRRKNADATEAKSAQDYVDYDADALTKAETASLVSGWVATAETYASAEKRFVDDLVSANPGTIDLEMGLPANDLPGSERVAPRMDLVILETGGTEASIGFWEAKCANNSELRSKGEVDPKVRGQIDRYVKWMNRDGRLSEVQKAYRAAASVLSHLHGLTAPKGNADAECLVYWEALQATDAPQVIVQPGLVIGNYWPEGSNEGIASERMRQCASTFEDNGHREKLENAGIRLHQVGPDEKKHVLPSLKAVGSAA